MLVDNHTHIRHIILYHLKKGWNAAQSFRDLNELFGEGTTQIFFSNRNLMIDFFLLHLRSLYRPIEIS